MVLSHSGHLKETVELWVLPSSIFLSQAPIWSKQNEIPKIMRQSELSYYTTTDTCDSTRKPTSTPPSMKGPSHSHLLASWIIAFTNKSAKKKISWIPAFTSFKSDRNTWGLFLHNPRRGTAGSNRNSIFKQPRHFTSPLAIHTSFKFSNTRPIFVLHVPLAVILVSRRYKCMAVLIF